MRRSSEELPRDVTELQRDAAALTKQSADLKEFADFNKDFLTWAQGALKSGKTPEAAAAEWKVPEKYQGYSSQVAPLFGGVAGRLQRLQEEMKK